MMLYKYQDAKWAIAILRDLRLKVSPPNEFNDPFEWTPVTPDPLKRLCPDKLRQFNDWLRKQGIKDSSVTDHKRLLPHFRKTEWYKEFSKGWIEADMASVCDASKHFGVLCLSGNHTNIRMWAHYGDKHRGVAVGLDFDNEAFTTKRAVYFGKVKYKKLRHVLNPLLSVGEKFHRQMVANAITKSTAWTDEKEHRMVFSLEDLRQEQKPKSNPPMFNYFVHIRPETIRRVVLGCFILPQDECAVRRILKARLPHVKLIKLERHHTKFELVAVSASSANCSHTACHPIGFY